MKSLVIVAVAVSSLAAWAGTFKFQNTRNIDPGSLRSVLEANGFVVEAISCSDKTCEVLLGPKEKKDPTPFISKARTLDDIAASRRRVFDKMRDLALKWKGGSISAAEKDELLRMFVLRSLGVEP